MKLDCRISYVVTFWNISRKLPEMYILDATQMNGLACTTCSRRSRKPDRPRQNLAPRILHHYSCVYPGRCHLSLLTCSLMMAEGYMGGQVKFWQLKGTISNVGGYTVIKMSCTE